MLCNGDSEKSGILKCNEQIHKFYYLRMLETKRVFKTDVRFLNRSENQSESPRFHQAVEGKFVSIYPSCYYRRTVARGDDTRPRFDASSRFN